MPIEICYHSRRPPAIFRESAVTEYISLTTLIFIELTVRGYATRATRELMPHDYCRFIAAVLRRPNVTAACRRPFSISTDYGE